MLGDAVEREHRERLTQEISERPDGARYDPQITTGQILYGLAAMLALLIVGTIIGLIWGDASNLAGGFAVVTNILGGAGILLLLIALVVARRRPKS